ncbi:MAG: hypothetical protein ACRD3W_14210 [Terriglobales bacterium]
MFIQIPSKCFGTSFIHQNLERARVLFWSAGQQRWNAGDSFGLDGVDLTLDVGNLLIERAPLLFGAAVGDGEHPCSRQRHSRDAEREGNRPPPTGEEPCKPHQARIGLFLRNFDMVSSSRLRCALTIATLFLTSSPGLVVKDGSSFF